MSISNLLRENYYDIKCNNVLIREEPTAETVLTVNGSTTLNGSIILGGKITINNGLDIISGTLNIEDTTDESITTAGGIKAEGDGEFENLTVRNTLRTETLSYEQSEIIQSDVDSTGIDSGSSQNKGGQSTNKSLYVGYGIHGLKTDDSSSKTDINASLVLSGGASIAKSIYAGSITCDINTDSITAPSDDLQITSTDTTINGSLEITTDISTPSATITANTPSTDYEHGALLVPSGGIGCGNNINAFGNIKSLGILEGKTLNITNDGALSGTLTAGAIKMTNTCNKFSTDGAMTSNSDSNIPTEKAVVTYVSNHSGSTPPAGANTQLQYNNSGNFGANTHYSIDDTTTNISKLKIMSANSTVSTQIVSDGVNSVSQIQSNASNGLELFSNSYKQAVIKNGTSGGSLQLYNNAGTSSVTLNQDGVNGLDISGTVTVPSSQPISFIGNGLSNYNGSDLNIKNFGFNGNLRLESHGTASAVNISVTDDTSVNNVIVVNKALQTVNVPVNITDSSNTSLQTAGNATVSKNLKIGGSTFNQYGILFNDSTTYMKDYDYYSIEVTFSTGSTTIGVNMFVLKVGRWVQIYLFSTYGLANANNRFTAPTGTIPSKYVTLGLGGFDGPITVTNNNTIQLGRILINPYGAITVYNAYGGTGNFSNNSCIGTVTAGVSVGYLAV